MTSYAAVFAVHKTLTTTQVDTIVLSRWVNALEVMNRAGGSALYITIGQGTTVPADPVAGASDVYVCPANQNTVIDDFPAGPVTVKIVGSANDYSLIGHSN